MSSSGEIATQFANDLSAAIQGKDVDPFRTVHSDVVFRHHNLGVMEGLENFRNTLGPELLRIWKIRSTFGIYVTDLIEDGDQVCLVTMGRCEGKASSIPYNNMYMFMMRIEDEKIIEAEECYDSSVVLRAGWDMHLEW